MQDFFINLCNIHGVRVRFPSAEYLLFPSLSHFLVLTEYEVFGTINNIYLFFFFLLLSLFMYSLQSWLLYIYRDSNVTFSRAHDLVFMIVWFFPSGCHRPSSLPHWLYMLLMTFTKLCWLCEILWRCAFISGAHLSQLPVLPASC